jgi:arginase
MQVKQANDEVQWGAALGALAPHTIAVLGVPFDGEASYGRGPALAPPCIRKVLRGRRNRMFTESGLNLDGDNRWSDMGDLILPDSVEAFALIDQAVDNLLARGCSVVSMGGDHSITYPLVRGFARHYPKLNILQLDAHPDIRDELDGNRFSHACPFARIMEEGLASRLVQVGIRFTTPDMRRQWERFGVEVVEMRNWPLKRPLRFNGPVYLSLDIDALDPAFAPGVTIQEPGGLSTRDVLSLIQTLDGDLVGADLVEFNPANDSAGGTAVVAGKLLKELVARLLSGLKK